MNKKLAQITTTALDVPPHQVGGRVTPLKCTDVTCGITDAGQKHVIQAPPERLPMISRKT